MSYAQYMVFTCKVVEFQGAASARAAAVTTGSSLEALLLELRFTRLAAVTTHAQHLRVHALVCSFRNWTLSVASSILAATFKLSQ